jgi:hypothetical protein
MPTTVRQSDSSNSLWYLALSLMGSWSWLFYLLYVALR